MKSSENALPLCKPSPVLIWLISTPEEACQHFDLIDLTVKEVRASAGDIAADYYQQWLIKRIL